MQALSESAKKAIQEHDEDDGYILMPQVLQMPEVQAEVSDPRSAAAVAQRVMMEKATALEESGWITLPEEKGSVYFEPEYPRVCIRGRETKQIDMHGYSSVGGYDDYDGDDIFPFYELRSAACHAKFFCGAVQEDFPWEGPPVCARSIMARLHNKRAIRAQLDTLMENNIRHVVLGAFGCGAFSGDAHEIANIYRTEIEERRGSFDVVAFAIYDNTDYRDGNLPIFRAVFEGFEGYRSG